MAGESVNPSLDAIRRDALRRLGRRPMSRAKLLEALTRRWKDADAAESVVSQLEAAGLIDDRAFAQEVIRQEFCKGPAAAPALSRRLMTLGVDESLAIAEAEHAVAGANLEDDALRYGASLIASMPADAPDEAKARRLARSLARRGFDDDVIQSVIERLLEA